MPDKKEVGDGAVHRKNEEGNAIDAGDISRLDQGKKTILAVTDA